MRAVHRAIVRACVSVLVAGLALAGLALPASAASFVVSGSIGATTFRNSVSVVARVSATGTPVASFSRTDANGHYILTLPGPGTYDFAVNASGTANGGALYGNIGGGATFTVQGLTVNGPSTNLSLSAPEVDLQVHLVDPDGNPVEGFVRTRCTQQANAAAGILARSLYTTPSSVGTDPTARGFVLDPGAGGNSGCSLEVTPRLGAALPSMPVTFTGADEDEITVIVPALTTVSGHLVDPFAGGSVQSTVRVRTGGRTLATVTPDAAGDYSFQVTGGTYSVSAESHAVDNEESYFLTRVVTVPDATTLDFAMPTLMATVHLVDGSGDPVAGTVQLSCEGGGLTTAQFNGQWVMRAAGPDAQIAVPSDDGWSCRPRAILPDGSGTVAQRSFVLDAAHHELTFLARTSTVFEGPPGDHSAELVEASGPNGGDANYDGVADYAQANVATLPREGAAAGSSNPYSWMSVSAPEGTTLADVRTLPTSGVATPPPAGVSLPAGLVSYTLTGVDPGADVPVAFYVGDVTNVNGYAKYDSDSGTWSLLPAGRVTVDPSYGRMTVVLTDGGPGDADSVANGTIVDPGGPAVVASAPADTTPPTVTGTATTDPNAAGWYDGDVTIHWTATDEGSGVETQPVDTVVTGEGDDLTATSPEVCDRDGNCATGTVTGLKIDRTAPSVVGAATTQPNANGWYKDDVTVHWTVTDAGSGVATPPAESTVTGQGSNLGASSGQVCDRAGNCATGSVTGLKIDRTAPTVTGAATTQPNAAGWYKGDVTVHWTVSDGTAASSGVASPPADSVAEGEGSAVAVSSPQVCDRAGNCATGTVSGLKIDRTAPVLAVTGVANERSYVLGAVPSAGCSPMETGSGLAGPCTVSTTGGSSNGVGMFTTTVAATDRAGNTASRSVSYRVVYKFDGFKQPVNDPSLTPGVETSIFKQGGTVPLQFSLRNAAGQVVSPRTAPAWQVPVRGARTTAAVNEQVNSGGGSTATAYKLASGVWGYDWSTKSQTAGYLYTVTVALDDGTTHTVTLGLR